MLDSAQIPPNGDEPPSTPKLYSPALAAMAAPLSDMPVETPEYYWAAVAKSGWALKDVPEALKTPALCRAAASHD